MLPTDWRKKKKLSLRALAVRLGFAWSSVRRWETGEREAPTSVGLAYERVSDGEVTSEDLNRARKRFLKSAEGAVKAA